MDQKIKYIVVNYVIIGDELYKKVIDGVLLKWLGESYGSRNIIKLEWK